MGDVGRGASVSDFSPTDELKALYRQAAKELHPDLKVTRKRGSDARKRWRSLIAYEECDEQRIRQILAEWRSSPEQVHGDDTAAQLVRAIGKSLRSTNALRRSRPRSKNFPQANSLRLKKQVADAATRGRDLLAEIAGRLDVRIEKSRGQA